MENEKIFKALSEDESGAYVPEDTKLENKEVGEENNSGSSEKEKTDLSSEKLLGVFNNKIDFENISGYYPSKIDGVNEIGLFYRENFGNLLIDLKCTNLKKSIGFTLNNNGELLPMDRRSNSIFKDTLDADKKDIISEVKRVVDSLIPDSVIEQEKQYFYWETDEDIIRGDKDSSEAEAISTERSEIGDEENGDNERSTEEELDDKRLEVVSSINEAIPNPIGKIMTKKSHKEYDMVLVFKNLVLLESKKIGNGTYMIPTNIETEDRTKEEIYEQVSRYFGFSRKELRDKFNAESQNHPDHKLSSEEFTKNMTTLISLKYKEKISPKIQEIIGEEKIS